MKRLSVETPNKHYDIVIDSSFDALPQEIENLGKNFSKVAIISDDKVGHLYMKEIKNLLKDSFSEINTFTFQNGEKNKNLKTITDMYSFLIESTLDRKSLLVALGGGVTGDMVGFLAATYMRGIAFIQVPTSLLSQVDSSVGGKTGVDFNGYKNIVGAFYQPELVFINSQTLKTLPSREFSSGMGEVIKHGFIADPDYLDQINQHAEKIQDLDSDALEALIYTSCKIKAGVVSKDEKEEGMRAFLNFGHTAGHAVERLKNFKITHGECVAIGMVVALQLSVDLGVLDPKALEFAKTVLEKYELPVTVSDLSAQDVYEEMFLDKKTTHNTLNYVLLEASGKPFIHRTLEQTQILNALHKIII